MPTDEDCSVLPRPQPGCPAIPPWTPDSTCERGAICDYACESPNCVRESFFCPEPGAPWRGVSLGCDACSSASETWAGVFTMRFALLEGGCGVIGDVDFDVATAQFEAAACTTLSAVLRECRVTYDLNCETTNGDPLSMNLTLTRYTTSWAGVADVSIESVPCTGRYAVATMPGDGI